MKKLFAVTVLVGFVLTGCNTVKGVGQDVSSAGQVVSEAATKTQQKL